MNSVLDPGMLFISDEDWSQDTKRDTFLKHLLEHLDFIDEYKITRVYWSDEMEAMLWGDPPSLPWRKEGTWKNKMIPVIYSKFAQNRDVLATGVGTCQVDPEMNLACGNRGIMTEFLKLLHLIIHRKESIFFCLGILQHTECAGEYCFSCVCENFRLIPKIIRTSSDWLNFIDITQFWPRNRADAGILRRAIQLFYKRYKNMSGKEMKYNFDFSNRFIEEILNECEKASRQEIINSMIKRLCLSQKEASSNHSLKDEPVMGKKNIRRFRVGGECRIHYSYKNGTLSFESYFGGGKHDKGL